MARVTSKLQVTIPKRIADRYGIRPGDDLDWLEAGEAVRVVPAASAPAPGDRERRLALFDAATARQRAREADGARFERGPDRGWRRDDLYERASAR